MPTDITRAQTPGGVKLDSLNPSQEGLLHLIGNHCCGKAGVGIDATPQDVQTTAAVDYSINGVAYTLAIQAAIDLNAAGRWIDEEGTAVDPAAIADDYQAYLLLVVDSAGAIKAVQGTAVAITATAKWARCPAGYAPFGGVLVDNQSGAAFTPGTTSLATAGVTDTYYDLMVVPGQTSP